MSELLASLSIVLFCGLGAGSCDRVAVVLPEPKTARARRGPRDGGTRRVTVRHTEPTAAHARAQARLPPKLRHPPPPSRCLPAAWHTNPTSQTSPCAPQASACLRTCPACLVPSLRDARSPPRPISPTFADRLSPASGPCSTATGFDPLGTFPDEFFDAVSSPMAAVTPSTLLNRKTPTSKNHEKSTYPTSSPCL